MTAQPIADSAPLDAVSTHRLLEGLSRIHPWMLVVDAQRRVAWMSDGLAEFRGMQKLAPGVDARDFLAKLPRPEQIFPVRSSLRGRSHLHGAPLELFTLEGRRVEVDLDLARVDSPEGELLVVIATERSAASDQALDAQLIEALPDALLAIDSAGAVRQLNAAARRLLEAADDRVLGRPITALLAAGATGLENFAELVEGPPRVASCELSWRAPSGRVHALEASVTPLRDGARSLVLRDVTEDREALERLHRSHEELDQSVGALAHDLRSPLVGLLGFSRLLRQDYAALLEETGRHFVDRIEQSARTMESLIHDLLELARIGQARELPVLVDPHEVLLQLAAELKPRLEETGIELVLGGTQGSRVYCDRSRLYQVLSNLIVNAIEHMGERRDARIEVAIEENEHGHEIVVADNGRGVAPRDRDRIFEIFQSVGTRADGRRGTGMGLAIVKKIAEKHGGRVWLESEPGDGARFHVTLPRR